MERKEVGKISKREISQKGGGGRNIKYKKKR